jgi:hypothetical protein
MLLILHNFQGQDIHRNQLHLNLLFSYFLMLLIQLNFRGQASHLFLFSNRSINLMHSLLWLFDQIQANLLVRQFLRLLILNLQGQECHFILVNNCLLNLLWLFDKYLQLLGLRMLHL